MSLLKKSQVFRFFSSIKLAVVLLAILIIAAATGTVCESKFTTSVARAYIYEAPWFNIWLLLLAVNVGAAALSRYPWKKRHTGFLITHAGIITLLAGALVGRIWGEEGTQTLFMDDEPTSKLTLVDKKEIRVRTNNDTESFLIPLDQQKSNPSKAIPIGKTLNGWNMEVTDYSELLQSVPTMERVTQDGSPAVQVHLWNPKMGQVEFKQWLWPDDPDSSTLNAGLMAVQCRRGAFSEVNHGSKSEKLSSKSDSFLAIPDRMTIYYGDNGHLTFESFGKNGEEYHGELLPGKPLATHWADWQINVEEVVSQALSSTKFVPVAADVKLSKSEKMSCTEGLKVRFSRGNESHEEWLATGWQVTFPMKEVVLQASFGPKVFQLPFSMELKDFQVERNAGTDSPASFKSTLLLKDAEGNSSLGSCSMNEPMNFPASFWRTCTGFTWKISQTSWNPENLKQSSVQILFDPGWLFKWVGSLMICLGIFSMFYLNPERVGPRPKVGGI